jgi:hypothetical protein
MPISRTIPSSDESSVGELALLIPTPEYTYVANGLATFEKAFVEPLLRDQPERLSHFDSGACEDLPQHKTANGSEYEQDGQDRLAQKYPAGYPVYRGA